MEKCYKNFILCGEVDYYCLLCREAFCTNTEVEKHLRWENHRKNVKNQEYIPKFKKDFIYKISDKFYCEICNLVIKSPSDHIKQDYHQKQRSSNKTLKNPTVIKYDDNGSIKINDKEVSKEQWHGILKEICFICNEHVNIASHLTSHDHMVKLIQSEIICKDNQYYRKLGEEKYYCFTCFKPFEHSFNIHAEDHKKEKMSVKSKKDANNNVGSYIIKILMHVYKDTFSYDVKNKTATCYECQETIELDVVKLSKHMSLHISDENTFLNVDHGKRRAELKVYGKNNFIKLNRGGSMAFCYLCSVSLSPHMKVFKQHVEGSIHQGHLELKGLIEDGDHEKPSHKLVPLNKYFDRKIGPFQVDDQELIVMNGGVCIGIGSYLLVRTVITYKMVKVKCLACDIMLDLIGLEGHINSKEHTFLRQACKVIPMKIKGEDEFIRQIKPDLYHCGFCHKAFPFWENITRHLQSFSHELEKDKKKLLSFICAKRYTNPLHPLEEMEEYQTLRQLNTLTNKRKKND